MADEVDYSMWANGATTKTINENDEPVEEEVMIIETADEEDNDANIIEPQFNETEQEAERKTLEANELYKSKNYKLALIEYTKIIELCPTVAKYYNNRAACYMMLFQYRDALDDVKKCIELRPSFIRAYRRMIRCCLVLGEVAEAEQTLNKEILGQLNSERFFAENIDFAYVKRHLREAEVAYNVKDYRKVVWCMDCCLKVSTSCRRFKVMKAECLALLGKYLEAQEISNYIVHQDPRNADAVYVSGMCFYYLDNVERAVPYLQKVLRLAPDHTKALAIYKKAKSLNDKKVDGNAKFKLGRYQEAYNLYTEALKVDPENKMANTKLHFNKATVAAKLGRLNESVSECTEALNLDENYLKAILRRANSYMELQNFEEAVRDYERACKIDKSRDNRRLFYEAKEALRKSKRKDYYEILGVGKNASADDIKKAYKKCALVHHPDRHANASEATKKAEEKKFKDIGEAYTILSDSKKRSCYDAGQNFDGVNPMASENYDGTFAAFFQSHGRGRGGFQFRTSGFPHGFSY